MLGEVPDTLSLSNLEKEPALTVESVCCRGVDSYERVGFLFTVHNIISDVSKIPNTRTCHGSP